MIEEILDYDKLRQVKSSFNKARAISAKGRKMGAAAKDIAEASQGYKSNKRRKRFWEKKPFQDALVAAALMGGGVAAGKYGPTVMKKMLLARKARDIFFEKMKNQIEFGEYAAAKREGWRVSQPTGTSIKIERGTGRKRTRRTKTTWERTETKNNVIKALSAGLLGTSGLAAYAVIAARARKGRIGKWARPAYTGDKPVKEYFIPRVKQKYFKGEKPKFIKDYEAKTPIQFRPKKKKPGEDTGS